MSPRSFLPRAALAVVALVAAPRPAHAEVPVQRTFFRLPSSNGHGAVLLDLQQARLTHFREHLFASEEPQLDAGGNELWNGNQPLSVLTRDVLYDAYFGIRAAGNQRWLTSVPVDLDRSGYAGWAAGANGGTGVATMVQKLGDLETTQYFFAPTSLPHAAFVMAMRVKNTGVVTAPGVSAFSLHNFHLGFGRPGSLADIGEQGETIEFQSGGGDADFLERAFAGVVVARALGAPSHHGASNSGSPPAQNVYAIVNGGGTADLPDLNGTGPTADGSVSAYQFDFGDLGPGEERWVGVAFAHQGDPFAGAQVQGWLDGYVGAAGAQALVDAEIAGWASFQADTVTAPASLSADEEALLRQSAAMLRMAQVKEESAYLREFLATDGEPRFSRFPGALPGVVNHRGHGAVIASLPPGQWTYAWIRDGAYATVAMAELGMQSESRDALSFYLDAEGGRFQAWNELQPYAMPPYLVSLTRYHGFGVEETDFNDFGPNLEFDGFGLFLWALRAYEAKTGDLSLVDGSWPVVSSKVADVLVALIDPENGLIRRDSSIWESHWNGRERHWAYTSITAARGLCDAAALADRVGDTARAAAYRDAGSSVRAAIAARLTDEAGAIASNAEELGAGQGYWDAAVLDAIAFGLFDPQGRIAKATLAGLDQHLIAPAGAGWSRNDDRSDHAGGNDLSPWGSEYDSAEWVITDLRGAIATRMAGDTARSDRLLAWVRDQSLKNYLAVAETYDEGTGVYKFNAPMVGFGAGAYALAIAHREGAPVDPACGAYYVEGGGGAGGAGGGGGGGAGGAGTGAGSSTSSAPAGAGGAGGDDVDDGGCGCRTARAPDHAGGAASRLDPRLGWMAAAAALALRMRARRRRVSSNR
jgi:hypothetical protein